MNERIKELALQAGAIKCHGYIPHPELDGHLIWAADVALDTKKMDAGKFAELIIEECVSLAEEYNNDATLQRTFSLWDFVNTSMKMPSNVGVAE